MSLLDDPNSTWCKAALWTFSVCFSFYCWIGNLSNNLGNSVCSVSVHLPLLCSSGLLITSTLLLCLGGRFTMLVDNSSQCLTGLICYYLLVICLVKRLVAWQLYKDKQKCMEYDLNLYVKHGKRMTSKEFLETLWKVTMDFISIELSIRPLRHIMITILTSSSINDLKMSCVNLYPTMCSNRFYTLLQLQLAGHTRNCQQPKYLQATWKAESQS